MRLLQRHKNGALVLVTVADDDPPSFAILSHTWGRDEDEITYQDIASHRHAPVGHHAQAGLRARLGYEKLDFCLAQAARDGLEYVWIDTCCIDKHNQQELNKAINWMFRWYGMADRCYVFMSDVYKADMDEQDDAGSEDWLTAFASSRWFERGWTLQELLAPRVVEFFSTNRRPLGNKIFHSNLVESITGIPVQALLGAELRNFDVQERFNWIQGRQTKEPEDRVYSLFGILGVSFPPNYGEGEQSALRRLRTALLEAYSENLLVLNFHQDQQRRDRVRNVIIMRNFARTVVDDSEADAEWWRVVREALNFEERSQRRLNIQKQTAQTCEWLLVHPVYRTWTQSPGSLLWIKGKPGTGKSTLVKFADTSAVEDMSSDGIIVSFYFNARGTNLEKSTEGLYRSVLCQLMDEVNEAGRAGLARALRPHKCNPDGHWTHAVLQLFFTIIATSLHSRPLVVFIDALDECRDDEVREMLHYLEDLGQSAVENGREIRMCFASRYYPALSVPGALELRLDDQRGHAEDLERHIRRTLSIGDGERAHAIRNLLLQKANGIFIWAVLVIQILNTDYQRGRVLNLSEKLESLPEDMSNLFRLIIHRDVVHFEDFVLCLQLVLFAEEPLTPKQFFMAMMASSGDGDWNIVKDSKNFISPDIRRYVLHCSKGLVDAFDTRVEFIHETVRHFLLYDGGLRELLPSAPDIRCASHDRLKNVCLRCLKYHLAHEDRAGRPCTSNSYNIFYDERKALKLDSPFLDYAAAFVLRHAERAAPQFSQANFLHEHQMDFWFSVREVAGPITCLFVISNHGLLHMLARYGAPMLIRCCIRNKIGGVDSRETLWQRSPLHTAIEAGQPECATVLLDEGAEIDLTDTKGFSPLALAVYKQHLPMVKFLLEKGANVAAHQSKICNAAQVVIVREDMNTYNLLMSILLESMQETSFIREHVRTALERGSMKMATAVLKFAAAPEALKLSGALDNEAAWHATVRRRTPEEQELLLLLLDDPGPEATRSTSDTESAEGSPLQRAIEAVQARAAEPPRKDPLQLLVEDCIMATQDRHGTLQILRQVSVDRASMPSREQPKRAVQSISPITFWRPNVAAETKPDPPPKKLPTYFPRLQRVNAIRHVY
jgi:hypothetical protein